MAEPDHARARLSVALLWAPGVAVGLGAGVVTAHGLYVVADAAGVPAGIAWLYPLITDGLALVAYSTTHRLRGAATRYAWAVVILAAGLSGLAQAVFLVRDATVDASPVVRFGVGAWPAMAAAVVAHLLYLLGSSSADEWKAREPRSANDLHGDLPPAPLETRDRSRATQPAKGDRRSARATRTQSRSITPERPGSLVDETVVQSAPSVRESRPP